MKPILSLLKTRIPSYFMIIAILFASRLNAQICSDPSGIIYGLTGNGAIYPINVSNASTGSVVKNSLYSGNSVNRANGLAYSNTNGKFYYFKRNVGNNPQEFVSYDPATATVSILSSSTCDAEVHTGCITEDGLYYFTIDIEANLNRYDIINDQWTKITSAFTDQYANNVTTVIQNQNAGDIAFDGNGNLWIITSSSSNYGVYMLPAPLPSSYVPSVTVNRRVAPTTPTPSGNMIAGIAFNPSGQIFMSTKSDNRLYRLEDNLTTTLLGTFNVSDVGNDLTSCAFPHGVLPVTWTSFQAFLNDYNAVNLNWGIIERNHSFFHVQHSTDGNNWNNISQIEPKGSNEDVQEYSFLHRNPSPGNNYYRIRTSDESGKESYSQVRMVTIKMAESPVSIWPNPVTAGYVNIIAGNNGPLHARIYDLSGKLHLEKTLQPGESKFATNSLTPGLYLLMATNSAGLQLNRKLVIQ